MYSVRLMIKDRRAKREIITTRTKNRPILPKNQSKSGVFQRFKPILGLTQGLF